MTSSVKSRNQKRVVLPLMDFMATALKQILSTAKSFTNRCWIRFDQLVYQRRINAILDAHLVQNSASCYRQRMNRRRVPFLKPQSNGRFQLCSSGAPAANFENLGQLRSLSAHRLNKSVISRILSTSLSDEHDAIYCGLASRIAPERSGRVK